MGNKLHHDRPRYRIALLVVGTATILIFLIYRWETRRGCFSYSNFERITIGMPIEEAELLLGSTGFDIKEKNVTMISGNVKDAPPGWNLVVWGDSYKRWGPEFGNHILIGIRDGKVLSKWYWEYSL